MFNTGSGQPKPRLAHLAYAFLSALDRIASSAKGSTFIKGLLAAIWAQTVREFVESQAGETIPANKAQEILYDLKR